MIVDFACDVDGCDAPVEFVKGKNFHSTEGIVTLYFFRCLNQHYYMKYKEELDSFESKPGAPFEDEYEQEQLPFEE